MRQAFEQFGTVKQFGVVAGLVLGLGALSSPASAQQSLNLICSVQEEWCRPMAEQFEKETGIKVLMTRKSTGETYAQLKAEASNPKVDIWWGGTGDPHMQAAEDGLTEAYESPMLAQMHDWSAKIWKQSNGRTIGIYSGALGFGYNTKVLAQRNLTEPKCWADLINPKLKDEVQVADPSSSGTSYTLIATMVQIMGEEKAFDYMKALHKNINQYTKSGAAPSKATSLGETTVGIGFLHDYVATAVEGAPVKIVAPCEGTGYEIGSMSIVKGAKNLDAAKKWYDWALTPKAQALAAPAKSYQIQSNKATPVPAQAPKMDEMKLIDFDFAKYGSSAERKRLLARWDAEVRNAAK